MSSGFGKNSGPTIPTSGTTPFGYFSRPPSPTPSPPFPDSEFSAGPSARTFDAQAGARPHSSLGSNGPFKSSSQLHAAHIRAPFLHKGDKQSPVARDFGSQTLKRTLPSSPQDLATSISSKFPHFQNPGWSRSSPTQYNEDFLLDPGVDVVERAPFSQRGDMQNPATRDFGSNSQKRSFASTPQDLGTGMSSKFPQFQNSESSRSPPIQYNEDFLRDSGDDIMERNADTSSVIYDHVTSQRRKSPPSTAADLHSIVHHRPSWSNSQRPATFSEAWSVPGRPGSRSTSSQNEGSISPAETDNTRNLTEFSQVDEFQRNPYNHRDASKRPSISPPKSRIGMSGVRMPDSQRNPRLTPSADGTSDNSDITRPVNHSVSKRTRSSTPSAGQIIQMNSNSTEDDTDREEQAKAKRLARFKTELDVVESERGGSIPYGQNVTKGRVSSIKTDTSAAEKQNYSGDIPSGSMENQDLDNEDLQSSSAIVGLCKDMCPESERGERERKGDLDPYERLDGDRNQTNKILAVKKYNRTAEREPELIRPLPILQKTMDYLIQLLDQPYDERFLGLYNFMWDRMRAIRMDLRMQHIFNDRAITMLEQMIRLHIIAMHELCEFSKGEGFSEGFDAHLNIEQMNKTSVELFQLYDDHRKRGIFIPTEKEFRGYYALLKLDKHPGYKVDPAELSLDLAKMTAEIRQTLEVLMARDVARFCRIGNFIAFFRHARKASYHQACLMHAHFSKLRTKALASLHSGLQYNQGIPVAHIAKWLAMEGEEIESLLEYHGFSIKEFEEPYMVKEGPFLNDAKDYPTRRSMLVHRKKSSTIMEDVLSSHQLITSPSEPRKELRSDKHTAVQPIQSKSLLVSDGQMEIEAVSSSLCSVRDQPFPETSKSMQVQSELGMSKDGQPFTGTHHRVSTGSPRDNINTFASFQSHRLLEQPSPITPSPGSLVADAGQLMSYKDSPRSFPVQQSLSAVKSSYPGYLAGQQSFEGPVKFSSETAVHSELEPIQTALVSANNAKVTSPASEADASIISSLHEDVSMKEVPREEFDDVQRKVDIADNYDKEVAEAKLRLLLRIWRRRSLRKKHIREQNRVAANAALSSLTVGPPIWQYQDKLAPFRKLNIDEAMNKRYEKRQSSLTRWNVSDLVASKLAEKHEYSSCICWKVILFSWLQHGSCNVEAKSPVSHVSLDEWLHYKLIPAGKEEGEDDLIISAPGLSVWRKWASDQSGDYRGYFSVIKDTHSGVFEKELVGVNAILFPISETVPWDIQKIQLDNLVSSLPAGSCIPLLITSGFSEENFSQFSCSIIDKLGLRNLDKSRISSFMVVCLNEDHGQFDGYFSDQQLKEGLMWLASASPSQPALFCVTIRELISLHLNSCLDALDLIGDNVVPHQCISAFNQALDQSINNIVSAAEANPTGWPCPELYLLDDSTAEFRFIMKFLPALGWSSPEEVEPLIYALRNCKLPYFLDDISWLNSGCSSEMDIEDKKQLLQDCLIRYLTQSSSMLNLTMATKEARVMVQKYTRLELHDTEFKMVPSWVLIFRRVFNWQLNSSTSFSCKAYVLEESLTACSPLVLEKMEIEVPEPHYVVHPMLDEMVEVSCSPIVSRRVKSSPKSFQKVAAMAASDNTLGVISPDLLVEEQNQYSEIQVVDNPDFHVRKTDMLLAPENDKKADRLSQLLDQCSTLQDDIEKRLSIYF